MGKAVNAATFAAHIGNETIRMIESRAASLGISKSKYGALIFERWVESGCPPVNDADRALQILKGKPPAVKKAS